MEIHTKRLLLAPLGPQYLASTHHYAGDIENTKYMVQLPNTDISETEVRYQCQVLNYSSILIDGTIVIDKIVSMVCAHFNLEA